MVFPIARGFGIDLEVHVTSPDRCLGCDAGRQVRPAAGMLLGIRDDTVLFECVMFRAWDTRVVAIGSACRCGRSSAGDRQGVAMLSRSPRKPVHECHSDRRAPVQVVNRRVAPARARVDGRLAGPRGPPPSSPVGSAPARGPPASGAAAAAAKHDRCQRLLIALNIIPDFRWTRQNPCGRRRGGGGGALDADANWRGGDPGSRRQSARLRGDRRH